MFRLFQRQTPSLRWPIRGPCLEAATGPPCGWFSSQQLPIMQILELSQWTAGEASNFNTASPAAVYRAAPLFCLFHCCCLKSLSALWLKMLVKEPWLPLPHVATSNLTQSWGEQLLWLWWWAFGSRACCWPWILSWHLQQSSGPDCDISDSSYSSLPGLWSLRRGQCQSCCSFALFIQKRIYCIITEVSCVHLWNVIKERVS